MFGFSKKEREEDQKAEAIEHGLDLFLREFRIALEQPLMLMTLVHTHPETV